MNLEESKQLLEKSGYLLEYSNNIEKLLNFPKFYETVLKKAVEEYISPKIDYTILRKIMLTESNHIFKLYMEDKSEYYIVNYIVDVYNEF